MLEQRERLGRHYIEELVDRSLLLQDAGARRHSSTSCVCGSWPGSWRRTAARSPSVPGSTGTERPSRFGYPRRGDGPRRDDRPRTATDRGVSGGRGADRSSSASRSDPFIVAGPSREGMTDDERRSELIAALRAADAVRFGEFETLTRRHQRLLRRRQVPVRDRPGRADARERGVRGPARRHGREARRSRAGCGPARRRDGRRTEPAVRHRAQAGERVRHRQPDRGAARRGRRGRRVGGHRHDRSVRRRRRRGASRRGRDGEPRARRRRPRGGPKRCSPSTISNWSRS